MGIIRSESETNSSTLYCLLPEYMPNPAPGMELGARYSPHSFNGIYFGSVANTTLCVEENDENNNSIATITVVVLIIHVAAGENAPLSRTIREELCLVYGASASFLINRQARCLFRFSNLKKNNAKILPFSKTSPITMLYNTKLQL